MVRRLPASIAMLLSTQLTQCVATPTPRTAAPSVTTPQTESNAAAIEPETVSDPNPHQPATVAAPRVVEQPWMSLAEWRSRHERQLAAAGRTESEVVFLGDSITEAWADTDFLRQRLAKYHPLNLGIGGDQTQHVLWRIDQGTLDGLSPQLVVILIGVNNLGNGYQPEETADGVAAVVRRVEEKLPKARILLLSVLPAGQRPSDELRRAVDATNQLLPKLAEPGRVDLLDIGDVLLEKDGSIAPETMQDFLHPTADAYRDMTDVLVPAIERLLDPRTQR